MNHWPVRFTAPLDPAMSETSASAIASRRMAVPLPTEPYPVPGAGVTSNSWGAEPWPQVSRPPRRYPPRMTGLIDQNALMERVAGDPDFLAAMVDIFVADAPTRLDAIRAGLHQ